MEHTVESMVDVAVQLADVGDAPGAFVLGVLGRAADVDATGGWMAALAALAAIVVIEPEVNAGDGPLVATWEAASGGCNWDCDCDWLKSSSWLALWTRARNNSSCVSSDKSDDGGSSSSMLVIRSACLYTAQQLIFLVILRLHPDLHP